MFYFLVLVLLFVVYIFFRVKFKELKKLFEVEPRALKAMQYKYGKVISAIKSNKRLRDLDKVRELYDSCSSRHLNELHAELFKDLDILMDDYLRMGDKERVAIRHLMSHHFIALLSYQYSVRSMLEATKQQIWLLRAFAATSIENCQTDFRDSINILEDLISSAEKVGMDWRVPLNTIAEYSDESESLGGGGQWQSTNAYLQSRAKSRDFLLRD